MNHYLKRKRDGSAPLCADQATLGHCIRTLSTVLFESKVSTIVKRPQPCRAGERRLGESGYPSKRRRSVIEDGPYLFFLVLRGILGLGDLGQSQISSTREHFLLERGRASSGEFPD